MTDPYDALCSRRFLIEVMMPLKAGMWAEVPSFVLPPKLKTPLSSSAGECWEGFACYLGESSNAWLQPPLPLPLSPPSPAAALGDDAAFACAHRSIPQ